MQLSCRRIFLTADYADVADTLARRSGLSGLLGLSVVDDPRHVMFHRRRPEDEPRGSRKDAKKT